MSVKVVLATHTAHLLLHIATFLLIIPHYANVKGTYTATSLVQHFVGGLSTRKMPIPYLIINLVPY